MSVRPSGALVRAACAIFALVPGVAASQAADLFFSEYIEGNSNNKAIEIYNGTGSPVDLSSYSVQLFTNGSSTAGSTANLSGMLADGDVYVIAHAQASAAILAIADVTHGVTNYNGDDALTLRKAGVVIDSIGQVGVDPGTEWAGGGVSTLNRTLWRSPDVCEGDADATDPFDPSLEWIGLPVDDISGLGSHTANCSGTGTPTLTINDVSLAEGNSGTTDFVFTVTLGADADAPFSVDWRLEDGSATLADSDYLDDSGTLNFAAAAGQQTITVSVVGDTQAEPDETFTVILENLQGATVDIANAIGTGTILNDDLGHTEIFTIQGSGASSPFAGQTVRTENNVVTAVGADGFAIQTPDARADGIRATSDGVYVFTGSSPGPQCMDGGSPRAIAIGDLVHVQGEVIEYFGMTEFAAGSSVDCVASGQPLPTPVVFELDGPGGDIPSRDPAALYCGEVNGQQNNFECLEGMLVSVPDGIVTTGNQRRCGTGQVCGDQPSDDAYAQVHIGPHGIRSLREPGVRFPNSTIPGNAAAGAWDGNPEILEMDADLLGAVPPDTELVGGARFSATGIIGYSFDDYELWPTTLAIDEASNVLPRPVRERADDAELSIATFNVLRLCNTLDDEAGPSFECDGNGSGPGGEPTQAELDAKIARLGTYIVEVLRAPDVVAVQEVETQAVLAELAAWIQAETGIAYDAFLEEGNDVGGIDNGFLVRSDRLSEVVVTQLQGDLEWADPSDGGELSPLHDRPPLLLEASFHTSAGGLPLRFAVMNNHARSRGGVDTGNERVRAKRFSQGVAIAQAVQAFRADPARAGVPLILAGDYNDYQFSDGYAHLVGLVTGTYDDDANECNATLGDGMPLDCNLGAPNIVDPPLLNVVDVIAAEDANEAYSYLFTENFGNVQGQARDVPTAQVLDHIMVPEAIAVLAVEAAFGRANVDASLRGVDTGSGPDGAGGTQSSLAIGSSDHDGLVLFLDTDCSANPNPDADSDGDGICDLVDNCPAVANADQSDGNGNGIGDACDADIPPVANDDAFTVEEDSGTTMLDVLANDTDADGGPMEIAGTYGSPNSSTSSTVTVVFYTPNPDYCGTDSFDYDLNGGSRATVTVTVTCVDDPPLAVDDAVTLRYDDGEVEIDVLANDTDVDGGPLEIASVTQGSGGTVAFTAGSVSYAAQDGFCGEDSFTYTVNGGSSATVQVTVLCERIFGDGFETD